MDYKIIKEYMDIDNVSAEKFAVYMELLREWNEKINLTAITDEEGILVKHFFDSCSISEFVDNNSKIIDIGTGAGFPGLPLKIVNDTLNLTLVDSLNKRINFLNVPLDVLHEEDMEETVMSLLNKEGPQQIIFMTIWDVLRARRNGEFRNMVK